VEFGRHSKGGICVKAQIKRMNNDKGKEDVASGQGLIAGDGEGKVERRRVMGGTYFLR